MAGAEHAFGRLPQQKQQSIETSVSLCFSIKQTRLRRHCRKYLSVPNCTILPLGPRSRL